jgi:hypothetical protein
VPHGYDQSWAPAGWDAKIAKEKRKPILFSNFDGFMVGDRYCLWWVRDLIFEQK